MRAMRQYYQGFFLVLFFGLLFLAAQGRLKGYTVTLLLDSSPLNGIGTLLSAHNVAHTMWVGFAVLALTFLLGRFFCGWVCPLGTIFQVSSWLLRPRAARQAIERNRYTRAQTVKYFLLIVLLVAAAFGLLQTGLLDPIALLTRTSAVLLAPLGDGAAGLARHAIAPRAFPGGALLVGLLAALVALNAVRPRFWCRYACPLGALLGCAARFLPGGVVRSASACTGCGLCNKDCPAACSPDTKTRMAECFVCWNCIEDCPERALRWQWLPAREATHSGLGVSRRQFLGGVATGLTGMLALKMTGSLSGRGHPMRIRPPGALEEGEFLARCLKCGECMKVCPTNVLQPAMAEAGLAGLWSPVMDMRRGYCELNCTLCGQVCPSGAIQRLTLAQKNGDEQQAPVKFGTAFVDRDRCLPWSFGRNCRVCQEVCPVSPKAIYDVAATTELDGAPRTFRAPQVHANRCTGCGLCEHECPIADLPAIRVSAAGESRCRSGKLFLG